MKKVLFFSLLLFAVHTTGWAQGVDTTSPDLPADGAYISLDDFFYSGIGYVLDNPVLTPLANITRTPVGDDEVESFTATFSATETGQPLGALDMSGPVDMITSDRLLSTTGTFDAEIISMSLSGGGILIREDPSRASTGQTDIIDLGGGLYHIDSFFDVFTEISINGGSSWTPSDNSVRMTLVPEPATLGLTVMGLFSVFLLRRIAPRRNQW